MIDLSEHRFDALAHDDECVLYRARREEDGSEVLVLAPAVQYPRPEVLKRLEHEYSLREELDREWAVKPLALNRREGQVMLVLEDPSSAAASLDRCLRPASIRQGGSDVGEQPMELGCFLRLAVNLAGGLGKLHRRGLIHKDIKPVHILVDPVTNKVWFTGFGISSRLARERPAAEPLEMITGTLAYMAPEQTGRMNRSIDSRSDLYSLGVTFYQMLTGALPFTASDPMDWVHCHVARQPVPPAERRAEVPGVISAVVMKLLAKTAEERYQTAAGLEADLRRALAEWESRGRIDAFPLGTRDLSDQLLISECLYGREREIASLHAAFERVAAAGGPELVLVEGQAGVGKSAVVHELHRALVPPRGLFASGKFDQYRRDIPYTGFTQALLNLIRPLLAKSEAELVPWRTALTAALGLNGALMVTMLPDLEYIIGPQPPVAELPPRDAQRRFQLVFRSLLGVFARPEHPLALFLDDLQWVDAATLDLLEDLLTQRDLQHLLLIGAYRDDEVTPTHPLMRRMAAIPQAGGLVQVVVLKSLVLEDVGRIVADALHCGSARPLARLVHEKTAGNPFFAIQFLTALAEEGLLTFDRDAARWTWDLRRIRAKGHTDNVVDLLVGKLRRLPATTQAVLKRLACLGNSTPIATLALVQSGSENTLHATLSPAIRAGVLFRQEGTYKFLHDRVREAAYALIPDGERAEAHLTIGRCLAARTPPGVVEESIFELVGQLNCGAALIRSGKEREWLAELNLVAGLRAKASTAYSSALTYLTQGVALLPEDAWERRHDLAFSLELHRAECEFLTGVPTGAEARLAELSDRAAIPSEIATLTRLRVDIFMTLGRSDRAVAVGLESLRRFNVTWAAHPTKKEVEDEYARLWRQLGDRPIEGLLDLPRMADPVACATMIVVASLVTPALWTDENLRCLVIGRMVNLSLEHGNSDASGYAYTAVGNVLGLYFGDYKAGFRFGQLGLDFVDQPGMDRLKARVYLAFGNLAKPPVRHARTDRPLARDAFEAAQQVGDLTYAGISCNNLLTQLLASGAPLAEVHQEAKAGLDFARRAHFGAVVSLITAQLGLIRTFRGLTPVFGCFNDDSFEEEQFERQLAAEPSLGSAAFMYWTRKLQARILGNDRVAAVAAATKAERLLWMSPVIFERADYHLYTALALVALCDAASDAASAQGRDSLAAHHRQLQAWAEHCPENFVSRAALVGAEIARIEGRELDAEHLYEQATHSARSNGLLHIEAVAYERASAFYRARGFDEIAALYLQKARHCYLRWGADGKVRQLDELYPNLRTEGAAARPTGEIEAPIDQLDLATVVKVSQTVSSEIHLDKLIETLLKLALEHAGAERGLLILPQGEQHRIEAEITVVRGSRRAEDQVQVQLRHAPITSSELPQSLFRYVIRTQQKIILDDASANNMFSEDDYLRRRCPRSILCLPLIRQTKMVGVLYLENNLAPRVFTQKRLTMLELVASQAAISLDRARVHAELVQENAERKRTEEELRRSEAFLAQGQRISHTGSWRWHVANGTVHWSEETFRILGANPNIEKPAYSLFMERVHPEDRTRVEEILNRAVHDMSDFDFDCRIVLANGSIKSLRSVGQPMVSSSGELEFIGTVMDITESKSAEAELRKQAQLLALAHDAIIVCDAQYRITFWNTGAVKTYGWTDVEAIGKVAPELLQTQFPVSLQAIKAALQEHGEWEGELRHITRQGSPIVVASRWSLRRGVRGNETILEINRDITDHKRAEEAWREAQAQLAHVTRVVTLGELAGSIAHEVNQPLTAIINNADACLALLQGKISEGDDVREALSDIISDADRASAVLARIRGLIKKSPPQKSRLDLNETIGGVIALTRGQLDRYEVLLRTKLANDLPLIMGDRIQLQQVMLNLIINSIEAMSGLCDGPRELWITSEKVNVPRESEHLTPIRRDADRAYVLVSVADSGPALDANALDTLFDAFYTTKPHGLGMGLSISRSIIESHGGRLWAKANVPKGALFQFSLPIGAE